jgi:hypothetical protein
VEEEEEAAAAAAEEEEEDDDSVGPEAVAAATPTTFFDTMAFFPFVVDRGAKRRGTAPRAFFTARGANKDAAPVLLVRVLPSPPDAPPRFLRFNLGSSCATTPPPPELTPSPPPSPPPSPRTGGKDAKSDI